MGFVRHLDLEMAHESVKGSDDRSPRVQDARARGSAKLAWTAAPRAAREPGSGQPRAWGHRAGRRRPINSSFLATGTPRDAYANAMCESFFATLEREPLNRSRFRKPGEARREGFRFIEGFHDTRRIHSALGHESASNYEKLNHGA